MRRFVTPRTVTGLLLVVTVLGPGPAVRAAARLSTDVVPVLEQVRLRADPDTTLYTGVVEIHLDVRKPTRVVALHAQGQKLERVTLRQGGKSIAVKNAAGAQGLLTLTATRPLARGPAVLEIRFSNPFNTQSVGLYRMVKDGAGYLFTQFEAIEARKAFPCWDEPSFKFPYQITIEIPQRQKALSNTPIERETVAGGWKTVTFKKTPPLPSYLLALAVGPLEFVDVPGMKFPTRIVTVKGQSRLAQLAVETVPPVMAALERYFGMPYPFEKLDLVAVPEYWYGAMENPGAITFTEDALLLDPESASMRLRSRLTRYCAHEMAHMWFGDLVTMAWWDDLWLNEAFADWMGDKITDEVAPRFQLPLEELQTVQNVMETDARPSTDPIRQNVADGNEAMRAVGLAYYKGKSVLSMFELWIGPESFRSGVNQYLRAHEWKNAVAGDLWAALGQVSGQNLTAALSGYIEQPGHPLVTVEPLADGTVRLTQRRFLNYGVKADPLSWKVPMALKWSDGVQVRTQRVLLEAPSAMVKLEGGGKPLWIVPNADARGYYRWSVPQSMILTLAHQSSTAMNPAERVAFLGNLAALLEAGELRGDAYLRVLADLADDPEPLVVSAVLAGLGEVKYAFVPDPMRDAFAAYVRRTLAPAARRFGLEKRPGESEAVSLMRPQLLLRLGRDGDDPAALALADRIAERYATEPAATDPALVGTALSLHALRGDRALFDRYRHEFENAKTPTVRQRYLGALGAFRDPAIQEEALRYVSHGPLKANEMNVIPFSIRALSDAARDRTFEWLRLHYAEITAKVPEAFQASLPGYANGCEAQRIAIARQFFSDPAHQVAGTEKELAQTAEEVEDCVGLREREGAAAAAYLRDIAGGSATKKTGSP